MELTLTFSGADAAAIANYAEDHQMTPFDFARDAIMQIIDRQKDEQAKAAYWAEIDKRAQDIHKGKNVVSFTDEEWEKFINEKELP